MKGRLLVSLFLHLLLLMLVMIIMPSCTINHRQWELTGARRIMESCNLDDSVRSYLDTALGKESLR